MKKALIIGGGVGGCASASELTKRGWQVTLIEKNKYLGGGCRTFFYCGHPYTEGPRPLYTPYESIFEYFNKIIPMRKFKLFLFTYVAGDGKFYTYPIHYDDILQMPDREEILQQLKTLPPLESARNFEQFWKFSVGGRLYEKFIDGYSKKMWKIEDNSLIDDFNWSVKGVTMGTKEKNAVPENIHAYPVNPDGYNQYFDYCLKDARVILDTKITRYEPQKRIVYVGGEVFQADLLISTISPDELMGYCFGELPYIGRDFLKVILPVEKIFPDECNYIYYANDEPFTRIVEYKTLTKHISPHTLLVAEIPSLNGKLYPFTMKSEQAKAKKYLDNLPANVYSIGRMGTYRYLNIGDVVKDVWDLIKKIEA